MHSKGAQKTISPETKITILKVKLPQLTIVQQNKVISDFLFNPKLIKSHTLYSLLQKSSKPQTTTSVLE